MTGFNIAQSARVEQLSDVLAARLAQDKPRTNGVAHAVEHEAITFLKRLDADGRHNLVALDPEKRLPPEAKTFTPRAWSEIEQWVHERDGRLNLYFSVNEPAAEAPHRKLAEANIGAVRAVWADVDPTAGKPLEAERERIRTMLMAAPGKPTIIDSGNGYQAIWRLSTNVGVAEHGAAAIAVNRSIAAALGGDDVHDLPRILRLPGTTNLPTATKKAAGRQPRRAQLVRLGAGGSTLAQLAAHFPLVTQADAAPDCDEEIAQTQRSLDMVAIRSTSGIADLNEPARARLKAELASDESLRRLWNGDSSVLGDDKSHSAFRAALAMRLARAGGFDAQAFGEILFAWDHAVGSNQDHAEVLNERTIARDWVRCGAPYAAERWFAEPSGAETSIWDHAPAAGAPSQTRFELTSIADVAALAMESTGEPLVDGLLECGSMVVEYGPSNVGKTFVALDIAFHVAIGAAWNGLAVKQAAVVYIAAEGAVGVRRRAAALGRRFGIDLRTVPFHYRLAPVDLLRPSADLAAAIEAIKSVPNVGLVVIDTMSRALAGGDENSSVDMGAYVKNLDKIRAATSACVFNVHHTGKDIARGARGHSLLRAATDTEIEIGDGQLVVTKQREVETNFQIGFVLEPVRLGLRESGQPVSSCVVRWTSAAPLGQPTEKEAVVLVALENAIAVAGSQNGACPHEIAVALAQLRTSMNAETVRTHLKNLAKKGLVASEMRGRWVRKTGTSGFGSEGLSENQNAFSRDVSGRHTEGDVFQ